MISPYPMFKKVWRRSEQVCVSTLAVPLKAWESRLISQNKATGLRFPSVFVIGPPRSGTTLAYQLLTGGLDVCYFSGIATMFFESPVVVSRITKLFGCCNPKPVFESRYGDIAGWNSPNQAWPIWGRWFPVDQTHVEADYLTGNMPVEIRATVSSMQDIFDVPFVNKWNGLNSSLLPLNGALPDALYVRIMRDPVEMAQSILVGREAVHGSRSAWLSTRPRCYQEIVSKSENAVEEVCKQIFHIGVDLDKDTKQIGEDRIFNAEYNDICADPNRFIAEFKAFYEKRCDGFSLKIRRVLPAQFQRTEGSKVGKEELDLIGKITAELQERRSPGLLS